MANELTVPELGENVDSGDVTNILVNVGDAVSIDQPLLELETGKATVEVPAESAGTVAEILVSEGDKVQVGQAVIRLEAGAEPQKAAEEPSEPAFAPRPSKPTFTPKPIEEPAQQEAPSFVPRPAEPASPAPQEPPAETPPAQPAGPARITVPDLGENITSGDITHVLVSVGDQITKDQSVLEIETGKATVEVPSTAAGTVKAVLVSEGDHVEVGQDILEIEGTAAAPSPMPRAAAAATAPKSSSGRPSTAPPPKPRPSRPAVDPATRSPLPLQTRKRSSVIKAGPAARKFAREIGVEISDIPGTGAGDRVTLNDVKEFSRNLHHKQQALVEELSRRTAAPEEPKLPDFSQWGSVRQEKMSTIRKVTAQHMATAWRTIPHVTQQDKADITELEKLRKRFSKLAEKAGGKLTPTAILLKVAGSALKVFPEFCASLDMTNEQIIYKDYVHIGVAVDTPKGLLVPVIRDVDKKNIIELSVELTELAGKARDGKISPADLQGGCFTISNLGGIGGTHFTPIVNHPEVAILGIGRGSMEPVYDKDEEAFEPRMMLPLSLSYDHRIIDGAQGARFLRWFCEAINEPILLALEG